MENLYMALADNTRLRLLNLMRDNEICVGYFTEVLGQSQPKISRHLAYLRNAGLVDTRRDGKWIFYSIRWPQDDGGRRVLGAVLDWLAANDDMRRDQDYYHAASGTSAITETATRKPESFISAEADIISDGPLEDSVGSAHNELEEFLL